MLKGLAITPPIVGRISIVRAGATLEQAISEARQVDERRRGAGFNQVALDQAARQGFANGAFEESVEDGAALAEEYFPEKSQATTSSAETLAAVAPQVSPLRQKLDRRMEALGAGTA